MRIISGRLKGRVIPTLKNANYRPSTGKFKEAIFSIITSGKFCDLKDSYVLDLFCGTCSIAFEALSRGARFATAVDKESAHIKISKEFAVSIGEGENISFLTLDATNLPKAQNQYDIIFMDPPYFLNLADKALISLYKKGWLKNESVIMIETHRKEDLKIPECYKVIDQRIYGNSKLIVLSYEE